MDWWGSLLLQVLDRSDHIATYKVAWLPRACETSIRGDVLMSGIDVGP